MFAKTRKMMLAHAETLEPGTDKAQCYGIANFGFGVGETIAKRLKRDHSSQDGHLRAALLVVAAGAATETVGAKNCYGTFTFEDGSTF